ncbi:MAG: hypothetical protein AAF517_18865 [Planctomycetota bacterium]
MFASRTESFAFRAVSVFAFVAAFLVSIDANAQGRRGRRGKKNDEAKKRESEFDIKAWGKLGKAIKGSDGFYEITYYVSPGPKKKPKPVKAFVKIAEDCTVFHDRAIKVEQIKAGSNLHIFGKPVERDVPNRGGGGVNRGGTDRQIQNAQVVLCGDTESFDIDERYKHPKLDDMKWLKAEAEQSKGGLSVKFGLSPYRVVLGKRSPVLLRQKVKRTVKLDKKLLRSGAMIRIFANKTRDRPETKRKSDKEKGAFQADRVVLLDRRYVRSIYPMTWAD